MNIRYFKINASNETLSCCVDYADNEKKPDVVILHGAGPTDKDSAKYISEKLILISNSVLRFDFSGHGESSG